MKQLIHIFLLLFVPLASLAQYDITFRFADLQDKEVYLGYRYDNQTYVLDTLQVNSQGTAHYSGQDSLSGGIYLMIYGKKDFYEFLVADDQQFTLQTATKAPIESMQVKGSLENELFFQSQSYLRKKRNEVNALRKKKENAKAGQAKHFDAQIDSIQQVVDTYWRDIVKKHPKTFYATLLKANNGDEGEFFDNVDFSDPRLLRSQVIYTTVRVNMARDLNAHKKPATIIKNADRMIEKSRANEQVFQYVLMKHLSFYRKFTREGIHKVFVHLADTYIKSGQASWLDSTQVENIMDLADQWRSSFEGSIAPDIEGQTPEGELLSLHETAGTYTLLFFWKTGCGHCEDAVEDLNAFYDKGSMDITIYAMYTKKNKQQWLDYINEHGMEDWVNVFDPKNEANYHNLYYVVSTPLLFLLNEEKRIIARRAGAEAIQNVISQLEQQRHKFSVE